MNRASESLTIGVRKSNRRPDDPFRRFGRPLPLNQAIIRYLKALWPTKADAELAARIGLSDRACRQILAERAGLTAEALAALLRTEDGAEVLEALMGDARPKWWRRFKRQMAFADVRRLQDEARARLEALEREEIV
jgi:hypothetical protein